MAVFEVVIFYTIPYDVSCYLVLALTSVIITRYYTTCNNRTMLLLLLPLLLLLVCRQQLCLTLAVVARGTVLV
jgi:hypothetical protein